MDSLQQRMVLVDFLIVTAEEMTEGIFVVRKRKLDIVDMQTVMKSGIMVVDRIPKGTQQVYF